MRTSDARVSLAAQHGVPFSVSLPPSPGSVGRAGRYRERKEQGRLRAWVMQRVAMIRMSLLK